MELTTECRGDMRVLHLSGNIMAIDGVLLTNKIEALEFDECTSVVVDISEVAFIESTALGSLIYCHKFLEKRGKPMSVADSDEHAAMLFRNCPLQRVFTIIPPQSRERGSST
jgi:anti-anti-sigma factor